MNQKGIHQEAQQELSSAGWDQGFEPLLDTEEAAALLKIHPKTLQRMARNGEITGIHIGKLWRFRASALNHWLEKIANLARRASQRISKTLWNYGILSPGDRCRLDKEALLFKRTTYQEGSLKLEERKGPRVWVYRWWDTDATGKHIYRKYQVGDVIEYPNESAAKAAVDAIRLTINSHSGRNGTSRMTVQSLWEHYQSEELNL